MATQINNQFNDLSTEEKIKNSARAVFHRKGFAAARTRDIAQEAGINLALLNYYFRSKEKLFNIVMLEAFQSFLMMQTQHWMKKSENLQLIILICFFRSLKSLCLL